MRCTEPIEVYRNKTTDFQTKKSHRDFLSYFCFIGLRFIYIILLVLFSLPVKAQSEYIPYHFVLGKEELSNLDIYGVFYDNKREIIYLGTDNGVYQYSQSTFNPLQTPEGTIGNSFFGFKKDKKGNVFCHNLNGQIFKIENGKVILHAFIPIEDNVRYYFGYQFDDNNRLWCNAKKLWYFEESKDGLKPIEVAKNLSFIARVKISGNNISYFSDKDARKANFELTNTAFKVVKSGTDSKSFTSWNAQSKWKIHRKIDQHFVTANGRTTPFEFPFKSRCASLAKIDDSTFVTSSIRSGLALGRFKNNGLQFSKLLFENTFISSVHYSENGILFLGTFKNGLIIVPNINFFGIRSKNLYTDVEFYDENNLMVSSRSGNFIKFNLPNEQEDIIHQVSWNIDILAIGSNPIENGNNENRLVKEFSGMKHSTPLGKGILAISRNDNIFLLFHNSETLKNSNFKNFIKERQTFYGYEVIRTKIKSHIILAADTVNSLLYSSNLDGLWERSYSIEADFYHQKKILNEFITDLYFQEQKLYCGTNSGVVILKNGKIIQRIKTSNGLISEKILQLKVANNRLFILTSMGIQIYDLKQKKFLRLGVESNVLGSDIIGFDVNKWNLAVLRKSDYFTLPLSKFYKGKSTSKIYLDSILVNEQPISLDKTSFTHSENSFSFFVDYRDIETKFQTKIEYKLSGAVDNWKTLPQGQHQIDFLSIPVGEHTFSLRVIHQGDVSEKFIYRFTIAPPYWQTWWFYLLAILLGMGIIGTIAWFRIQTVRRKARQALQVESSRRIATSAQLKAIRAQMNPHFIFNSINSIQDLVLQKETLKSYDYLGSFSRLVRMTLDHSEREFVSLTEEIDFLTLYLELETLRFDDSFSYELKELKTLNSAVIPSLIIQPFVENALKHGLLHKFGEKNLTISFKKVNENQILCIVQDDGIGREESTKIMERRGNTHSSFSTKAIKNRMKMLGQQLNLDCKYDMIDLKNEDGTSAGTKIEIYLPIIRNKKL